MVMFDYPTTHFVTSELPIACENGSHFRQWFRCACQLIWIVIEVWQLLNSGCITNGFVNSKMFGDKQWCMIWQSQLEPWFTCSRSFVSSKSNLIWEQLWFLSFKRSLPLSCFWNVLGVLSSFLVFSHARQRPNITTTPTP